MALVKQPIPINFSKGLQTKADSKQIAIGNFLALNNSIFDVEGRLTKRNGFANITTLPNEEQTTLTTLNSNLIATGSNLYSFNESTSSWINQGTVQPVSLSVTPLIRVSTSQTSPDAAVSDTGLTCLVYVDNSVAYYQVSDTATGQQVVGRTAVGSTATNPRLFVLGRYFIITFMATVAASPHIRYIAIPIAAPTSPHAAVDIDTTVESITTGYDAYVANNNLYLAWSGSSSTIKMRYMSSTLVISAAVTISSQHADLMSVTADTSGSTAVIWVSWWDSGTEDGYSAAYNQSLGQILAPAQIINGVAITHITSVATQSVATIFYENENYYDDTGAYPTHIQSDFVSRLTVTQAGGVAAATVVLRSVGLASKPILTEGNDVYLMFAYGETSQPTYFLASEFGDIYMRLAYANGGGYAASQVLPTVSLVNSDYYVPYRIKTFLAPVNKGTALPSGTPTTGIYTQTGINLAKFSINTSGQYSSEVANALHLTGGQLWEYDGVRPVEFGFHVWPENVASSTTTGAGGLTAQDYYYAFCYEWTDNQGNLHRSAPSIPKKQTTTTGSSTNTLYVPTLRLTYKDTPNPVRIVGYRWSTAQPVYYQFTSITSPTVNDPGADYVTISDANTDSAILGQTVLYTTGGVVENIAPPASTHSALYKNRLWLINAEDGNSLWYSKTVIANTPVEMSDLFTMYIAPTTGAQGSTGKAKCLAAMDDKLVIFKDSAAYYLVGNGPDITGANNDFTDPVYINIPVGCSNPNSIVSMPDGLMFQSQKGIWLLRRDLGAEYIGAPVEAFNSYTVRSATSIPDTNQVRFVLDNNITLVYDYYYKQWGTFSNTAAISSTLYEGYQTYLNSFGQVFQETPGTYVDGSRPVLLSFTTGWINIAGIQGYERFYFLHLLGTYLTPFKLNAQIAYDYNPSPTQATLIEPDNFAPYYGDEAVWGSGGPWGGSSGNVLSTRLFPERQKCEAFQVTITEVYDPSEGVSPGAGFNLSSMLLTIGVKKGTRTQKASQSFG